ncbi:hypothetical protein C1H46_005258 [Malus baccata]|uniref:Protein phosphatase n=1 Tax=Malus baccata TaxID=106549 RepID=A0A540NDH8_MALBA|nr:hypothetical protein C1H46_005258 [Malus baccata]
MRSGILPKVNTAVCSSIWRVIGGSRPGNSKTLLPCRGKFLSRSLGLSCSLPYSTPLISDATRHSSSPLRKGKFMAASSSAPVFGDVYVDDLISSCGNSLDLSKPTGVYFNDRRQSSFQKASLSLRKKESFNGRLISVHVGPWLRNFYTTSSMCYATGAAHNVTFDGNSNDEQPANSTILSDQPKALKLLSGSCYLPHPDKEATGGEDAHFICEDAQAIGVADGVGGWADVGVNAGYFSRELMSHSVRAIQEEPEGGFDPARVLEKAHSCTKAKGSSTACIIGLTEKGLQAINLGDSGFLVVRDGCTVFQSPVQQHGFNFTYQLESGSGADLPSSGQVFLIPVASGDVIIAGTDGLFDNLYNNEITAVVVHAVRAGLAPQVTAQKIAALARQRALDKNRQTPFSTAAQEAGFRYYGGKLDDLTVVVSYVTGPTKV